MLSALLALCLLGGGMATTALVWADYRDSRAEALSRARHQARLFEEMVGRALDEADAALRRSAALVAKTADDDARRRGVQAILGETPVLAALSLYDPHGRAQGAAGRALSDPAGQGWFAAALDGLTMQVGAAMPAVDKDGAVVPVARALRRGDGTVLAVAVVGIAVDRLTVPADEEAQPPPFLSLFRSDGGVVLAPSQLSRAGDVPAMRSHLLDRALPNGGSGTFVLADAERSIFAAYRAVAGRELVAVAGLDGRRALKPWRGRTVATLTTAFLVLVSLAALALLLAREMRREREVSAALAQANRELSRSNADLEQFAYVASHDLKEPLRNIASYVQLLQRRYQGRLDEDADAFIGYTVDGVRRLQMIIDELLVYSRIGTGRLTRGVVQTGGVLSVALANLKTAIAEAGAAVEVKGPLPVVTGDAGQLSSVFQNLIGNGLKYRRDDVRPELTVWAEDDGAFWRFGVADNGIGIDPQYHRQIFELFKRLHGRDRYTGSGIGLAVCQRVVERHGGEIWVESRPGQGATFRFTLPKE